MKFKYSFLALLFLTQTLFAANPIENFISCKLLENANISLLVKDIDTGKELYSYRAQNSEIPASTMKLVTTSTALEILGADFRFKTTLGIDGPVGKDGTLNGNLYIVGGGDPTLGSDKCGDSDFLTKWVAAVNKAGIKKITGQIIVDASILDDEGVNPNWTWEDIGNHYSAGVYGITYLDNTVKIVFRSGKVGSTPDILRTIPEIPGLTFQNYLRSSTIGSDSAYLYGAPHSNVRIIRGEIPANRSEFVTKGDIPNPGLLLAQHLQAKLVKSGVAVNLQPTEQVPSSYILTPIYVHLSPSLREIVNETNIHSNNLYAEQIFRYLGSGKNERMSTSERAVSIIRNFWKSKGLPVDQLFQKDGCGLSPMNAVSAQFFVELLTYMKTKSLNRDVFYNSLSVSGVNGTLSSLLKNTALQGRVHAKSGSISRVKCYAGYIDTPDKKYVFALLVNNANGSSRSVLKKMEEFFLQVTSN